jgi:hypothetical protein
MFLNGRIAIDGHSGRGLALFADLEEVSATAA